MTHEVCVPCDCEDIEACRTELYVADVRLLRDELERLSQDSVMTERG